MRLAGETDSYTDHTALEESGYNISLAARALGTTGETVHRLDQRFRLRTTHPARAPRFETGAFR